MLLIPLQFVILIGWWFYSSISEDWAGNWWNPFETHSVGTCLVQWGAAFLVLFLFNNKLNRSVDRLDISSPLDEP